MVQLLMILCNNLDTGSQAWLQCYNTVYKACRNLLLCFEELRACLLLVSYSLHLGFHADRVGECLMFGYCSQVPPTIRQVLGGLLQSLGQLGQVHL